MTEPLYETAEFVLPGHPDKLCDAAVDTIVETLRRRDPGAQCGLEAACVFDSFHLTGRIAASAEALSGLDLEALIRRAWGEAGYGPDAAGLLWGPAPEDLRITAHLCFGEFEDGERENRHLSDDQSICVGYASDDPATDFMPPAHWFARRIGSALLDLRRREGAGRLGPDGKVAVEIRRHGAQWVPTLVSLSLHHTPDADWLALRRIAEEAVETALGGRPVPEIVLNGAGTFSAGGPNGDNGQTGKKLVVDAYGPTVPIGGGAWSGKDLRKVDRLGGMLARELALRAVGAGLGRETLVRLLYLPGGDRPRRLEVRSDGRPLDPEQFLDRIGRPDLSNSGVWSRYRRCDVPLPELARWGHQHPEAPWEVRDSRLTTARPGSARPDVARRARGNGGEGLDSVFVGR